MSRAALLAAALFLPAAPALPANPPRAIDFGPVQLGGAAHHTVAIAGGVSASGAGFSATETARGVLVVFEPYELDEIAAGTLTVRTPTGVVRVALRGRGVDTIRPRVTVATPRFARAGRPLTIRFAAVDNDLVRICTLTVAGRVVARLPWPVSAYRWQVPRTVGSRMRVTVTAIDRAGNRGSATSRTFRVR